VIVEGGALAGPFVERAHTVVVGSGAGGAVVAALLAEAGVDTIVLEEGGRFQAHDFTQRDDEMFPVLYREHGLQATSDGLVTVLQGSCFGGSTVINMADCEPTPAAVYAHWQRLVGPMELDERSLAESQQRVMAALGVNEIQTAQVNANNDAVLRGAERLGLARGVFRHNRTGCKGSGYCLIGCAYDAKKGVHLTYLPRADAAGAALYTDVRVERIEREGDRAVAVTGSVVERGPRVARFPFRIEAERIVLAAGAVHSPALLAASGLAAALPQLGRNVSLQPQLPVTAVFAEPGSIRAWRGIPQAAFCSAGDDHTAEHGLGGFRLEAVSGGLAQVGAGIPGFGIAHKEAMARLDRTASGLLLVPDRPSGSMTWQERGARGVAARIEYRMQAEWKARLRRGMRQAAEVYFAAGAERVAFASEIFPALEGPDDLDRIDAFPIRTGVTRFISAHVQGSCRMSPEARTGVVDPEHRVHGLANVWVVDASVMPTSASTHTMIPVMTLADRAAHRMLERRG
jgi:choline dehydrogenase-like flavoprotein